MWQGFPETPRVVELRTGAMTTAGLGVGPPQPKRLRPNLLGTPSGLGLRLGAFRVEGGLGGWRGHRVGGGWLRGCASRAREREGCW